MNDYKVTITIEHPKYGDISRGWKLEDPYAHTTWHTEIESMTDTLKESVNNKF